jgi:hypothetical protein
MNNMVHAKHAESLCDFLRGVQLVGDMELEQEEVLQEDGTIRKQWSTVHIKKCRYLEQSGCIGMCVNMCKVLRLIDTMHMENSWTVVLENTQKPFVPSGVKSHVAVTISCGVTASCG